MGIYNRWNPKYPIPQPRPCKFCGEIFTPKLRKHYKRELCSIRCSGKSFCSPEHNKRVARASAKKRGDAQRGSGEGKSYTKLFGRHLHRIVAELKLGRALKPCEVVHHIDGDRRNNHPTNIQVLKNRREHALVHDLGKKGTETLKNWRKNNVRI